METLINSLPAGMLVMCRMLGLMLTHPIFPARFLMPQVRVAMALCLGLALSPLVPVSPEVLAGTRFLLALLQELVCGAVLGFSGVMAFAAVQIAGALLDLDIGFSMAQVFDPAQGFASAMLSSFFFYLALALFFAFNAHHVVIEGLVYSFALIPVGSLVLQVQTPLDAVVLFGRFVGQGFMLVLPALAALLLAAVVMAAVNRAVPQMHLFTYALSIKVLLGLLAVVLVLPVMLTGMESIFEAGTRTMRWLMEQMGP